MTTLPTMDLLIDLYDAHTENAKRAQFAKAKGQIEKLMILGVVTTCDDEMDRAMAWSYAETLAKEAGVSTRTMSDAMEYARRADSIIDDMARVYGQGETDDEQWARIRKAAEIVIHLTGRTQPGKTVPCKHNATKKEHGLVRFDKADYATTMRFLCFRCGEEIAVPVRPAAPSFAAIEAGRVVAALGRGTRRE